ncbi:MAG: SIMPL domain-containing protein [Candidatus Levybacteria bacterium]|nr:SIMPL domain-containing protein [Candidatus Levybacteria bacterium]
MWRQLQTPFFTVFLIFAFFYLFAKFFGPLPFSVNSVTTTKTDLFTVSGEGEVTAVPDTATFTVGVTQTANTVEAAKNQITESANKIIADLKRLGIKEDDIKTINYNVYPNQDYAGGRNTITGYTARQELQVKVKNVDLANKALDSATGNGANQVSGVSFTIDDEKQEKLEDQARRIAIDDAKRKARSIASAADIKLGRIISVTDSSAVPQPPIYLESRAAGGSGGDVPETDLQPGENTVRVTVSLSYETL